MIILVLAVICSLSVSALTILGRFVDGETNQPIAGVGLATHFLNTADESKFPRDSSHKLISTPVAIDDKLLAVSDSQGQFEFQVEGRDTIETVNPNSTHTANYEGSTTGTATLYDDIITKDYTGYQITTNLPLPDFIKTLPSDAQKQFDIHPEMKDRYVYFQSQFIIGNVLSSTDLIHKQLMGAQAPNRVELGNIKLWPLGEVKHCMASVQKPNGILLLDRGNLTSDEYDAINKGIYDGTLFPGVSPDDIHNLGTQDHVKLYKNLKYEYQDAGNCFLAVSPQEGPAETSIELVGLDYTPNHKYVLSYAGNTEEVTSDSTGRIDATFKLIDQFPNDAGCSGTENVAGQVVKCQTLIAIHNLFGTMLRNVFFTVTGEKSRFGSWLYKNQKQKVSDSYNAGVPNGTFVKTIELTAIDKNKQTCTFLLDSKDKVTVKVGDYYTTDFHGFTAFALSVYDVRTITENGVNKELCKMSAESISQNVVNLIINWVKLKIF